MMGVAAPPGQQQSRPGRVMPWVDKSSDAGVEIYDPAQDFDPNSSLAQTVKVNGLSAETLNGWMNDIIEQPPWRAAADVCCQYYDGNQYDAETLRVMAAKGIPPIVVNLVHPTINLVLGLEAKTRSDWVVKSESEEDEQAALAMSVEMKVFERETHADDACSKAYASQIKAGLGWVEVGINRFNPFGYRFRADHVHRREIWWDWHDDDPGLDRARWLLRRKWYDIDILLCWFPQHKELIEASYNGWNGFDPTGWDEGRILYMDNCRENERGFTAWNRDEWINPDRRRACLSELWYRTAERGLIVRSKDGKTVAEFDQDKPNPMHVAALQMGLMTIEVAMIPRMRLSWWIGPHKLVDIPSPYPHQYFPYVPFWGFREDTTGVPYGMIRMMKPLQDEVNARRAKMMQMLSTVRVIVEEDAVLDHKKLQKEVARPDAYIKLNQNRINKQGEGIRIEDHQGMSAQQFDVYMDSKQTLQDAGGVYQQQLGKPETGAESGIAISQLIEQGSTTLAHISSNFRVGRTRVGEIGMALLQAEMAGKLKYTIIEHRGIKKRFAWNKPATDESMGGAEYLENDVERMRMRLALADMPQTNTFRAQQLLQLTEMVKSLPPEVQGMVVDLVIKASDLPEKEVLVQRVRSLLGIQDMDPSMMDAQQLAEYQAKQQKQVEVEELQKRVVEMEALLDEASAKNKDMDTKLKEAQTAKTWVETGMDPGSMMQPIVAAEDPVMDMVDRAYSEAHDDVPGADPGKLARARGGPPQGQRPAPPNRMQPGGNLKPPTAGRPQPSQPGA